MAVDWGAVATVAAPIIALFVAGWWDARRTRLLAYYSHIAAINGTPPGGTEALHINTHTVVLRNVGRQAATTVRLTHRALPLFSIWPQVPYTVEALPGGMEDVVIPTLVPGQQIQITYLYGPPLVAGQINAGIRCDQGFAKAIRVLQRRQLPRWANRTAQAFALIGIGTVAYVVYRVLRAAFG